MSPFGTLVTPGQFYFSCNLQKEVYRIGSTLPFGIIQEFSFHRFYTFFSKKKTSARKELFTIKPAILRRYTCYDLFPAFIFINPHNKN